MRKLLSMFILLTLLVSIFSSCESYEKPQKQTPNEIPEQSINYTYYTFGNVIQDGKQAVFFNFVSDYTITKLEIVGSLLDKDNNAIHSFDTSTNFGTPSKNPELTIRIDKDLISKVKSVSFTKIKAYTTEEIN